MTTGAGASRTAPIRRRERDAVIQSLRSGVVPRVGLPLIQVGRLAEVRAVRDDLHRIADGGSGSRFVIGEYGSGKTFFMNLVRTIAVHLGLVTVHADLSPSRRLHASGGQARSLYAELMSNMATKAKPDGFAMTSVVERFVQQAVETASADGVGAKQVIRQRLATLTEYAGGYDFANVIGKYWQGHDDGNEQLKADAVRWLRAEFSTRTDARQALGVREIINDSNFYDHLKLMSRFVRMAGYKGMLVCLDEMVNLYKLANTQARSANYEQILRIVNDSLQGSARHLGFMFGGTGEFLTDERRGLYSYTALKSRLAENSIARDGLVDLSGPVIRLENLTPVDYYQLLDNLRHVFAFGDASKYLLPDEGLEAFMHHCQSYVGDAYFRTPRTTIKAFLDLLSLLDQHPDQTWQSLLDRTTIAPDQDPNFVPLNYDDAVVGESLTDLRL